MISGIEKYLNAKELTLADVKKAIELGYKEAEALSLCTLTVMAEAILQDKDKAYDRYNEQYKLLKERSKAFKEALELVKKVSEKCIVFSGITLKNTEFPEKDTSEYDTRLLKGFMTYLLALNIKNIKILPPPDIFIKDYLAKLKSGEIKW